MTTNKFEVRNSIELYCSIPPIVLDNFLDSLDTEKLEVLWMIINDAYAAGEEEACGKDYTAYENGYRDGYSDGYSAGLDAENFE